jgi:hypothetical protein
VVALAVYGLKTRAIVVESPTPVENVALRVRAAFVCALF